MRTAEDIVNDYRKRGYEDSRIRTLAASRSEPLRSEIMELLEQDDQAQQLVLPLEQKDIPAEEMPPEGHLIKNDFTEAAEPATAIEEAAAETPTHPCPVSVEGMTIDAEGIRFVVEDEIAIKLDSADILDGDCLKSDNSEIWLPEPEDQQTEQIHELLIPEFSEGYIPPELTVIETVISAEEHDSSLIKFVPDYALTPEQREQALEEQQDKMYLDLAKMLNANFAEYTNQLKTEESELVCADFDDIARPAEDLAQWKAGNESQEDLAQLTRQLGQEESVLHALEQQLIHESTGLAAAQQEIARLNDCNDALRHENSMYLRDVETLQHSVQNNSDIITGQSDKIVNLNGLVTQLTTASDEFMQQTRMLEQTLGEKDTLINNLESLIAVKSSEMDNLRDKLAIQNSKLEKLYEEKKSLEERLGGMDALQRELNILKTETIPNLNHDKEEMIELVGQELQKATELEDIASKRSRRLSYAMTFAAAACVMMILSPVLAWNGRESERLQQEAKFKNRMAQVQNVTHALQSERNQLRNKLQAARAEFSQAQQEWSITKASLMQQLNNGNGATNTIQVEHQSPFDLPPREMTSNGEPGNHNGVTNVEEWMRRHPTSTTENDNDQTNNSDGFTTAKVKRGEGLSQVLWRVYGSSTPQMVKYVSQLNSLKKDRRGNPLLRTNQKLRLPQDIKTAMLTTD